VTKEKRQNRSPDLLKQYLKRAFELGATRAKIIETASVVTGRWVRLKCQYGCDGYGQCLTCPPYSPAPEDTAKLLAEYNKALLLQIDQIAPKDSDRSWRKLKKAAVALEREIFLSGHYKAFAFSAGPCHYCKQCDMSQGCRHAELARPAMEACGIDVYQTARNNGFELEVVPDEDSRCSYLSLVLIY
jgi:predicted metal-binding protein